MNLRSIADNALPLARALRARRAVQRIRRQLELQIKRKHEAQEPLRLVIGAGGPESPVGASGTPYEGWILTDVSSLDALKAGEWVALFRKGSIARILAEHVVEHWDEAQFRSFLRIVRPCLAPEGRIRLAVPDGFHPDAQYIENVRPGGSGPDSDDHKMLYNYQTLTSILSQENWSYDLLEYFDEGGEFHSSHWGQDDGFIKRSAAHDPRNESQALSYTSLIIDLRSAEEARPSMP